MAYSQVSYGSTGSDVTELQKLLNKTNNGYNLSEDGKFGAKTQAAVKDYQKKNGLAVDGIVGKNTWGALTKATTPTTPTQQATVPTTASGDSQPNWQAKLNETLDKILNREKFSYDVNGDALYQQYKDLYTNQGKQAMMDTMGQASAMTGGYGNSYAQTVGQQTYQGYLQQLNDKVPELYQLALDQYNQEGQKLYDQYGLYLNERDYEHQLEREAVEDELNKKMYDYQLERDRTEDANRTQDNARSDVYAFLQSGVMPSDALISASGLDKTSVQALYEKVKEQDDGDDPTDDDGDDDPKYKTPTKAIALEGLAADLKGEKEWVKFCEKYADYDLDTIESFVTQTDWSQNSDGGPNGFLGIGGLFNNIDDNGAVSTSFGEMTMRSLYESLVANGVSKDSAKKYIQKIQSTYEI